MCVETRGASEFFICRACPSNSLFTGWVAGWVGGWVGGVGVVWCFGEFSVRWAGPGFRWNYCTIGWVGGWVGDWTRPFTLSLCRLPGKTLPCPFSLSLFLCWAGGSVGGGGKGKGRPIWPMGGAVGGWVG